MKISFEWLVILLAIVSAPIYALKTHEPVDYMPRITRVQATESQPTQRGAGKGNTTVVDREPPLWYANESVPQKGQEKGEEIEMYVFAAMMVFILAGFLVAGRLAKKGRKPFG